jgi:hypothetical protein
MTPFVQRLITGVTLLGGAAAIYALGYSAGKDTNEGTVNFIREKYQTLEKSEARLQAENTALKLELQSSRTASASASDRSASASALDKAMPSATLSVSPKPNGKVERVTLRSGQSGLLFGGALTISLVGVPFEGDPLRHKVIASIGSPGKENKTVEKADVGYATVYDGFEVRVLAAETLTATFQGTRLKSPP